MSEIGDLRAERDRAREECGFEKGLKESIRTELYNFIRLRSEALARAEAAEAVLARVRAAVAEHPDPCPEVDSEAGISCGWKRAFGDVRSALAAVTD